MKTLTSISPSTNEILGEVPISTQEDIQAAVNSAKIAAKEWRKIGLEERKKYVTKIAEVWMSHKQKFAELASKEMGMPLSQALSDVDDSVNYMKWNVEHAEQYLKPEKIYEDDTMTHTVYREPYGVAAVISPWNFPASNFSWLCTQNLLVGNTIVFKDSEEVPFCGKMIEEMVKEAGLPNGVFVEIYGAKEEGDFLVHQDVDLICFTGSSAVGQYLYKVAAEKFIKIVLELGGSAPGIVLEDADIDSVLDTIYSNRFWNSGQMCDALKRLIVHQSILEDVVEALKKKMQNIKLGDPSQMDTDIGPMVSEKQLTLLSEQVQDAIDKGANVKIGGVRSDKFVGSYFEPTLLTNVDPTMKVWQEEVFGPVLPVVTFGEIEDAIKIANDTSYGLGGYIFGKDSAIMHKIAEELETGMVAINNTSYVKPCSPFGGYKRSGMGREHGVFGFHDLTQVKVIAEPK